MINFRPTPPSRPNDWTRGEVLTLDQLADEDRSRSAELTTRKMSRRTRRGNRY